ncbi:MAG: DUF3592 domain-containing protein [Victivallaceae bacterium]
MAISNENIDRFLEQRIPRIIPDEIRKLFIKKSSIRPLLHIGIIALLFDIALGWFILPRNMLQSIELDTSEKAIAYGIVERAEKTNTTINHHRVIKILFSWTTPEGKVINGVCYSAGEQYANNARVEIEYLKSEPGVCRIKGCTLSQLGYLALLAIAVPLLTGFAFIIIYLVKRAGIDRLLQYGIPAQGFIRNVISTNVTINNQRRYKALVAYDDDNGELREGFYYAYGNKVTEAENKMRSGEKIPLLYDRAKPQKILPL